MFNAFTRSKKDPKDGPKAEFTWAEAQMTTRGMEVYALKSDTPLVENTKILNVDLMLSRIFHSIPEINIFFDTEGYLGRTRIYFTFCMYNPVAFTTLKSLLYKISTYRYKRCNEIFSFFGNRSTPVESCRSVVVDLYEPLHHFYLVSYMHECPRKLEPQCNYIGTYNGDMQLLCRVINNNKIVNMGFISQVKEEEIVM
ncbi:UNVERIFIED_CONTAM: hypothetical protein RMT77_012039 [Armadillidium vulgare]